MPYFCLRSKEHQQIAQRYSLSNIFDSFVNGINAATFAQIPQPCSALCLHWAKVPLQHPVSGQKCGSLTWNFVQFQILKNFSN
jgi:hypothetical protein